MIRLFFLLPWVRLNNSAWPESHQQHELHCGMGCGCDNLLEPLLQMKVSINVWRKRRKT